MKSLVSFLCAFIYCSLLCSQIFVNQEATGNNDGSSWDNAFTNLQDALDSAEEGDQIWVTQGMYVPVGPTPDSSNFLVHTPVQLYGGFIGNETSLDQRDWESNISLISGDRNGDDISGNLSTNRTDNAFHVLTIDALEGNSMVNGFHFRGGMTRTDNPVSGQSFVPWRGGAMYIVSSAHVVNCTFEDNFAYQGAAIYTRAEDPIGKDVRIENCSFRANLENSSGTAYLSYFEKAEVIACSFENNISGSGGAGISMGNVVGLVDQCIFQSNSASFGGGLFLWQNVNNPIDSSSIVVKRSQFLGNAAIRGGGIQINNFHGPLFYVIDSCSFNNNIATEQEGGAISMNANATSGGSAKASLQVMNSSFEENLAANAGGAIRCIPFSDTILLSVENSFFANNTSAFAGAILGYNAFSGSYIRAEVNQCTFVENLATNNGGGIGFYNQSFTNDLEYQIDDCSFLNNSASNFGGALSTIAISGNTFKGAVTNSTFENNASPGTGGAISSAGEELRIENCDFIGNNTEGTFAGYEGGGALSLDFCPSVEIFNSSFVGNNSDMDGSAILNVRSINLKGEGLLFQNNTGESVVRTDSPMELINVTMHGNDNGILMQESSSLFIQNSILHNENNNLISTGEIDVNSGGSNISNDSSTIPFLTGNGNYSDLNNSDSMLDEDLIPLEGSPCIDRGNPESVTLSTDLNGEERIQGHNIDIGCYETSFLSSNRNIDWESSSLQISPNPVVDIMNLNLNDLEKGQWQIQIFSLQGRLLSKHSFYNAGGSHNYRVDTQELNAGNYYVVVSRDQILFGKKFIKVSN